MRKWSCRGWNLLSDLELELSTTRQLGGDLNGNGDAQRQARFSSGDSQDLPPSRSPDQGPPREAPKGSPQSDARSAHGVGCREELRLWGQMALVQVRAPALNVHEVLCLGLLICQMGERTVPHLQGFRRTMRSVWLTVSL